MSDQQDLVEHRKKIKQWEEETLNPLSIDLLNDESSSSLRPRSRLTGCTVLQI